MEVFPENKQVFVIKTGGKGRKKKSARLGGRTGGRIAKRGGILIPLDKSILAAKLFPKLNIFSIYRVKLLG
jgi:hypothetical protein